MGFDTKMDYVVWRSYFIFWQEAKHPVLACVPHTPNLPQLSVKFLLHKKYVYMTVIRCLAASSFDEATCYSYMDKSVSIANFSLFTLSRKADERD